MNKFSLFQLKSIKEVTKKVAHGNKKLNLTQNCNFEPFCFQIACVLLRREHTVWTVNDVLVYPYPFIILGRSTHLKGCGSIEMTKEYGLTKTSLTVHAVCIETFYLLTVWLTILLK